MGGSMCVCALARVCFSYEKEASANILYQLHQLLFNFKSRLLFALRWCTLTCPTERRRVLFEVSLALGNNLQVLTSKPRIKPPNGHPTVG